MPDVRWSALGNAGLEAEWRFPRGEVLRLVANLGTAAIPHLGPGSEWGRPFYALGVRSSRWDTLPPWSVAWYVRPSGSAGGPPSGVIGTALP